MLFDQVRRLWRLIACRTSSICPRTDSHCPGCGDGRRSTQGRVVRVIGGHVIRLPSSYGPLTVIGSSGCGLASRAAEDAVFGGGAARYTPTFRPGHRHMPFAA